MRDVESAWHEGKDYFLAHRETITGTQFYEYTKQLAAKYGWEYGNEHCGHLIGSFPHERIEGDKVTNYIHPENDLQMNTNDSRGSRREWIYEIHFVNNEMEIGGFFEQLMF